MKIINIVLFLMIVAVSANAQSSTHTVTAGETFYSIAKMYNTTVNEIKANNPNVDQNNMSIGTVLNVYTQPVSTTTTISGNNNAPIYHTVAKGETLFGLAKRTYNIAIDDIKNWNNMLGNELSVGQNLIVGWANGSSSYTDNVVTPPSSTTTYQATTNYPATQTTTTNTNVVSSTKPVAAANKGKIVYTSTIPARGDLTDLKDSRTVYTSTVTSTAAITNTSDKYDAANIETVPISTNISESSSNTTTVNKVMNETVENVETAKTTNEGEDMITKKYGSIATGGKLPPREIYKSLETSNDASLVLKKEEGVAKWFELEDKSIQIYAMHASAPIGSALKITNPLNDVTIYVKVIDTLTPTAENSNTLLRLSSNAMSILKMYDKAFMINVSYFDVVDK